MKTKLANLISETINGEWGEENFAFQNVNIIRAANFNSDGTIDFSKLVKRAILQNFKENGVNKSAVDFKKIENKKLLDDDIIIEKSGGGPQTPVGRTVYFINPDNKIYLCNNFTQIIRVDKKKVNPKYFFYGLQYLYDTRRVLKYQNQTTGLINLKLDRYLQEKIEVPSLDVQLKISTQLQILQDLIDKRKESFHILNKLLESTFFKMFGDPVNNQNNFPIKKLKDIVKKDKIITYGIVQAGPNIENGIPYIRSGDIKKGEIKIDKLLKTSKEIALKFDRSRCDFGDIVMSIRASIGEVAIIPKILDGVNLTQGTARISPNEKIINRYYLLQLLSNNGFAFLLNKHVKGSTFKEISLTKLREIKIPICNDIMLQNKFSDYYLSINLQKQKLQQSLDLLEKLFRSVLHNSFNKKIYINETPIFNELIKEFNIEDLKNNYDRLQNLINLFSNDKLNDIKSYTNAKDKVFELLDEEVLVQSFDGDKINLNVK